MRWTRNNAFDSAARAALMSGEEVGSTDSQPKQCQPRGRNLGLFLLLSAEQLCVDARALLPQRVERWTVALPAVPTMHASAKLATVT